MTIDEAIEQQKLIAENHRKRSKEIFDEATTFKLLAENHNQLAEWLEELKAYRENSNGYNKEDIELNRNAMYNKAIDDLLGGMNQITYNYQNADELFEKICDLAEQLKAGGTV